jgi:hypothetical protein
MRTRLVAEDGQPLLSAKAGYRRALVLRVSHFAPCCANSVAIKTPMPRELPVMSGAFPFFTTGQEHAEHELGQRDNRGCNADDAGGPGGHSRARTGSRHCGSGGSRIGPSDTFVLSAASGRFHRMCTFG